MDSKVMFVQDENGNEVEMEILFTFDHENINYVVFKQANQDDDEVFASRFNEDKELLPIESDAEWAMIEEVILAFSDDHE